MARTPRTRRAGRPVPRAARAAPALDALVIEGALIAPAQLAAIAAAEAGEQTAADYRLRPGLALRDEIPLAYRVGQTLFAGLMASPEPSAAATAAFTQALMRDVFGFPDGTAHAALGGRVPVVMVPPADGLDGASATLSAAAGRRTSAALALQDRLNGDDGALWGLACNGLRLRLMRDNPSLTRPAYIEADLRRIFEADALSDFSALWLLLHASRFGAPGTSPTDCALERWRDAGQKVGETARERLREGVEKALALIGDGLLRHPANAALRDRLRSGELPLPEFFNQLLQLAYRMIFLLVAEDRGLLHPPAALAAARALYAGGYSLSRLRARAVQPARDAHDDLWDGLCIVMSALARGEPRLGLPALDGLFAPGGIPHLAGAALANRALLDAVHGLAWLDGAGGAPVPVNWRDIETEELGSVYEALLELTPRLVDGGRGFAFAEGAETRGNQRKTTGSYYTPDGLVQALLASALDPVLDRVQAEDPGTPVEHFLGREEAGTADPRHTDAMPSPLRLAEDLDPDRGLGRAVSLLPPADPAAALLGVRVLDPACGSGHFLLAAGRHIAARVARLRAGGTAGAAEYRHALRDVARACLHGVDRNPMAIMLAKVALWIETVEPGLPLGFLDANLRCGDALLGVFDLDALRLGIPDAAYKPLAGDDPAACRALRARNRAERDGQGTLDTEGGGGRLPPVAPLARAAAAWRALPEDSPAEIAAKRSRFEAARSAPDSYALHAACDLYLAAFLSPKPLGAEATPRTALVPTTSAVWARAAGGQVFGPLEGRAVDLARAARAFHWPLEFPDVMASGGFDAVLGNPPWDRIKLQEKEFFAARAPEVAEAPNAAERKRRIEALERAPHGSRDRVLFAEWETAKRVSEAATEIVRVPGEEGGRFPLTGCGDVNTYSLFAELFTRATSVRGRAGVIVPTGIATDATTAPFFGALIAHQRLVSLHDFQTGLGYFNEIGHARFKFCLLTVAQDGNGKAEPDFSFFSRTAEEFQDPRRHFRLSPAEIARINPNTQTAPLFRTETDAALTATIHECIPIFVRTGAQGGNPWSVEFMAMFHMANDSGLFKTAAQLAALGLVRQGANWVEPSGLRPPQAALALAGGADRGSLALDGGAARQGCRYVPLYEAKMVHQFDHRWATYDGTEARDATKAEHCDPGFEPTPRYWLPQHELPALVRDRGWLLGWRDICRATDERTLIAGIIPTMGCNDKFLLMHPHQPAAFCAALYGSLNSLTCDYVTRQKLGGTSFKYFTMRQIAILPPSAYSPAALAFIVPRVLELTYTSHSLAPFARDLGDARPPFAWDEARRATLRAELDAWYARAYGLTRDELRYVLDPSDTHGPAYPSETFRVLREKEVARHGEYRTRRLVLDAWDGLDDSSR